MTIANQIVSFKLSGINYTGTSTQLNYTSGVTQGACSASKSLVVDSLKNITGINSLSATNLVASILTGTISTPSQPNITSLGVLSALVVSGNLNISGHNGSNTGLQLNGSLVTATSAEINYNSGVVPGTASAGKSLVLNSSRNISNINSITSSDINVVNNLTVKNVLYSGTGEHLNYLVTTLGEANAGKALIFDSNKNITGIGSVSASAISATNITGTLSTPSQPNVTSVGTLTSLNLAGPINNVTNISFSGNISGGSLVSATTLTGTLSTVNQPNITSVGTLTSLNVTGRVTSATATIGVLTLGSTQLDSTGNDLNKLSNVTNGTASADKALVVNSSRDLSNINVLTAASLISNLLTGTIQTPSQPNITSLGALSSLELSGSETVRILNNTSTFSAYNIWLNPITIPVSGRVEMDNSQIRLGSVSNHPFRIMSNNVSVLSIETSGNVNIGTQTTTPYRLNVAGSLNSNTLFINGSQVNATASELNLLTGITSGSAAANKALIVDSGRNIGSIGTLTSSSIVSTNITGTLLTEDQPNIKSLGTLTSLTVNSTGMGLVLRNEVSTSAAAFRLNNDIRHVEIGLRGSTAGTNTNLFYMLNNGTTNLIMDVSGNFTLGGSSNPGNYRCNVAGSLNSTSLFINGNQINATPNEINLLSGITLGQAGPGKVLSTDSNRDLSNIRNLSLSGSITGVLATPVQTAITQVGILNGLTMTGNIGGLSDINMSGNINGASVINAVSFLGQMNTAAQPNITSLGVLTGVVSSGNVKVGTVSSSAVDMLHIEGNNSNGLGIQIENRNTTSNSSTYLKFTGYSSSSDNYDLASITCGYVAANANFGYGYLAFATRNSSTALNATERMRITDGGNVGIGKSTPLYTLDVDGVINASELRISGSPITATVAELNRLSGVTAGTGSSNKVLVLDGSRNVGNIASLGAENLAGTILTASQPNITSVGTLSSLNVSGGVAQFTGGMYLAGNLNSAGSNVSGLNSLSAVSISGTLTTDNQPNITTLGTLAKLSSSGVVKIGTTANEAQDLLHIEHITSTTAGIQLDNMSTVADSGSYIKFNGYSNSNSNYDLARITCGYVAANSNFGYGYLSFSTRSNSANSTASERMRITESGRVGIAQSIPSYQLDVNGTTRVAQLLIGTSTDNVSERAISALNSSMTVGSNSYICFGRTNSAANQAELIFRYSGAGSGSNAVVISTHSQSYKTYFTAQGYIGVGVEYPVNNLHINQIGTNTCLRLDRHTGVSTQHVDLGCTDTGKLYINDGAIFSSTNSDPLTGYVVVNGTQSTSITNYGYLTGSGVVAGNGSSGTFGCSLRTSGRIVSGAELNVLSDFRIKKNITDVPVSYCRDFVYKVSAKKYTYKNDKTNKENIGYIAQDVVKAGYKELFHFTNGDVEEVIEEDGFVNPKGQLFTLNYENMIPILSTNIKELFEENKTLKSELQEMKKLIKELSDKINN